jgi:hypothetical protein
VPSARLIGKSFVPDYSLKFHKKSDKDGSAKCNIVVGGTGVYVAVFEIDEVERRTLDQIEGVGSGYERVDLQLEGFGVCSTYVAASTCIDDSLCPMDWYKEYVVRGAQYNVFPGDYVSILEQINAVTDTDAARARREWALVEALSVQNSSASRLD